MANKASLEANNIKKTGVRTLAWGFDFYQSEVIKELEAEGVIDVKMSLVDKEIKDCTLKQWSIASFTYRNSWINDYFDEILKYEKGISENENVYNSLYSEIYQYFECESRYEKKIPQAFHQYLHKFNLLYHFFYAVFLKEKIELCLFSNLPHLGIDWIIYKIAKALNVRTILFINSSIPKHYYGCYYLENVNDYGNFSGMKKNFDCNQYEIECTESKDYFYMKPSKKKIFSFKELRHSLPFYKKSKYEAIRIYKQNIVNFSVPVDYNKKYIYFALYLQPELTTSCLGGIYCDQMLALERLSKILPSGWVIYVKENPSQKIREQSFFDRLKMLNNVKMVPIEEASSKLVRHAQIVSTITGTVGWEALCRQKPVLFFGKAWYQRFDGAFKYHSDISILQIANYKIDKQKLLNDYNEHLSKMPKIVVDDDYLKAIPDFNRNENMKNLKCLMHELVENQQSAVNETVGEN